MFIIKYPVVSAFVKEQSIKNIKFYNSLFELYNTSALSKTNFVLAH